MVEIVRGVNNEIEWKSHQCKFGRAWNRMRTGDSKIETRRRERRLQELFLSFFFFFVRRRCGEMKTDLLLFFFPRFIVGAVCRIRCLARCLSIRGFGVRTAFEACTVLYTAFYNGIRRAVPRLSPTWSGSGRAKAFQAKADPEILCWGSNM